MSYDIQLFKTETKNREQSLNDENFFDNESNLAPFTAQEIQDLTEALLDYGYEQQEQNSDGQHFSHPEYTITALLTNCGLYFTAGFDGDSIFEAGMAASELTDTGEFQKYDPQNGGWQED